MYCNENDSKRRQYRIHFMLITDVTSSFSPLLSPQQQNNQKMGEWHEGDETTFSDYFTAVTL